MLQNVSWLGYMVLFHKKMTNRDEQAGDVKEGSKGEWDSIEKERKASQSIPFMLTPPPVHPVVIVAAWFTDIISIAKANPCPPPMHSAADAEAPSLFLSAVSKFNSLHIQY